MNNSNNYAAIDLGSNSCRLLITDCNGKIIYRDAFSTKLAEGLFSSGKLSDVAIQRAVETFYAFAEKIREYKVLPENMKAIATAACRMAANSDDFLKIIKDKTGITLEIIDERQEAELNLLGAITHVCEQSKYVVVYDLGGASTEVTFATNTKNPHILHTISIPWGARNATEAFELSGYSAEKGEKLRREIDKYMDKFITALSLKQYDPKDILYVATSSTPLRLSSLIYNDKTFDRILCDGRGFNCADADKVIAKMINIAPDELAKDERVGENRAPIFAAACVIFQTIYQKLGARYITASLASAREGIIQQLREKNNG